MKNFAKFFAFVAVAVTAFASCERELNAPVDKKAVTIVVKPEVEALLGEAAPIAPASKTYIDSDKKVLWGTGEYMKIAVAAGETTSFADSNADCADSFNGESTAEFEFSFTPGQADSYTYMGLYPASAAATTSNTNAANYKVNLLAIQNATASSYDPAAYIMVAKPKVENATVSEWLATFRRATALNKITLKNVPSGVSFNKVKISAPGKKLAGGRHFNLTTGEGLEVYGTDATIEVLYATALTGTNVDVWFTSWDTEIAEGEKLTIVAYTTDNKSYTKEITVPAGKTIKFLEGYLNTLGASLSGINPDTVSALADGDYLVLAKHNDTYYAMKGEANGTRIASVDYNGSLTNFNGDASLVWTITASGSSYTIKNNGKYVGWNGGSGSAANNAVLIAVADYDADKCLMSIDDNGDGSYKVTNTKTAERYLAKNTNSAWFAFYGTSGQYGDIVFVPATALETVATPTFSPAAGEVTSGTEVTISCATNGATIYYTTDGTDPTTSSTQGTSVTITATTTIKAIAVKEGMANSEVATAQYTIAGATDYSVIETSNVTLSTTGGTSASTATVNGNSALKAGTGSVAGAVKITVPAGTTTLHLHAAGWNGENVELGITGATASPSSLSLTADSGIKNNSPFTLSGNAENYYFCISLSGISTDTQLTFTATSGKRFVIWGVNAEAGASVTWNLESISITSAPTTTVYTAGDSFDPAGMVVKGHFVDADDATNTKDEEVTGYTITPSGALATTDTQVTITYQSKTATQNITVNEAPAGNDGSLEHPYTASEARELALSGDTGSYYISGIVTKVLYQFDATHGTSTFWIDENGASQTVFEGYGIKYFGNVKWVEGNAEIAVNDEVIIYGTLTVYKSTTPEAISGYLVSLNGKTKGLTLAAPTVTTSDSDKQITVAWTAATGTESAISYVVTCGSQTYNASGAGSHTFTMADYGTYNVLVVASADDAISATASTTATLSDPGSSAPDPETVDFSAQNYTNQQAISSYNGENFTITFNKGSNSNAPKYYTSGTAIRAYGGNTFTVSSANYKISGIVITFGSSDGSNEITTNVGTYSAGIWTGSSQSVTFTIGGTTGNRRIQKIKVTYE